MLELKDSVMAFAWEPKGHRFVLIHGERDIFEGSAKPNVSFYSMKKEEKLDITLISEPPAPTLTERARALPHKDAARHRLSSV